MFVISLLREHFHGSLQSLSLFIYFGHERYFTFQMFLRHALRFLPSNEKLKETAAQNKRV